MKHFLPFSSASSTTHRFASDAGASLFEQVAAPSLRGANWALTKVQTAQASVVELALAKRAALAPEAHTEVTASAFWTRGSVSVIEATASVTVDPSVVTGPVASDYTGDGQVIVVIDSGYSDAYDQSQTIYSYDFYGSNDPDATVVSTASHGSWVAATALQTAADVDIIHLKVSDDTGEDISLWDVREALQFTVFLSNFIDIAAVNISLGAGNATSETWSILSGLYDKLDTRDILVSVAAGNAGDYYADGVSRIAANDNVVAVSASTDSGAKTDWSQASETLTDIFADGTDYVISTSDGSETYIVSGTSFAAPTVAAIAARLQEAALDLNGETLSDEEILEIMQASGDAVTGYEGSGVAGYVVADADAALTYFIANSAAYVDDLVFA